MIPHLSESENAVQSHQEGRWELRWPLASEPSSLWSALSVGPSFHSSRSALLSAPLGGFWILVVHNTNDFGWFLIHNPSETLCTSAVVNTSWMSEKDSHEGGVWAAGMGPAARGQKSGADYRAHTSPRGVSWRGVSCDDTWFLGTRGVSGLTLPGRAESYIKQFLRHSFPKWIKGMTFRGPTFSSLGKSRSE